MTNWWTEVIEVGGGGGPNKTLPLRRFRSAETEKLSTKTGVMARAKRGETPPDKAAIARAADEKKRYSPDTIRILVVDDHPLFRHGLVQLLNSEQTFSVVGEASSAPEALA